MPQYSGPALRTNSYSTLDGRRITREEMEREKALKRPKTLWYKQVGCDVIAFLWPVMPRRLKLWAFMNDHLDV